MINLEFFNKTQLPLFFKYQFTTWLIIFIFSLLITKKSKSSPLEVYFSILILIFYSYFIHILFHLIPKNINIHLLFHHDNEKIGYWFSLLIELITNICFFIIFYYIKILCNVHFIPNSLIFFYGLIYVSTHIINYSIFHFGNSHVKHHTSVENKTCNYGPDTIDHFLNTNCSTYFEDLSHILPNILISYLLTYYYFKPKFTSQ